MCGFLGIVGDVSTFDLNRFENARIYFEHRGPDEFHISTGKNYFLASARLAVIDPENGQQPCRLELEKIMVYNGEIYNRNRLVDEIDKVIDVNSSDTEILYKFISKFSNSNTNLIEGQYAFGFWDITDEQLILGRDANGEKPLYYYLSSDYVIFSSSADAIRYVITPKLEISRDSVTSFLQNGFIDLDASFYQDINQLAKSSSLTWNRKSNSCEISIHPRIDNKAQIKNQQENSLSKIEELDNIFKEVIRNQLLADIEVGVFLSGGLDSSLIAYYARENLTELSTFSINLANQNDDHIRASKLSRLLDTNHHEVLLDKVNFNEAIKIYQEKFDVPLADSGLIPLITLSRYAKNYLSVALAGEGGDELFAGYPWAYQPYVERTQNKQSRLVEILMLRVARKFAISDKCKLILSRKIKFLEIANLSDLKKYNEFIKKDEFLSDKELSNLGFTSENQNNTIFKNFGLKEALMYDRDHYLLNNLLVKADRASMSVGFELRLPFLANSMINFAEKLPESNLINQNQTKLILRELASSKMPSISWYGNKFGLGISQNNLKELINLDGELDDYLKIDKFASIDGLVDKEAIRQIALKSDRNKWMFYMLYKWLEIRI